MNNGKIRLLEIVWNIFGLFLYLTPNRYTGIPLTHIARPVKTSNKFNISAHKLQFVSAHQLEFHALLIDNGTPALAQS